MTQTPPDTPAVSRFSVLPRLDSLDLLRGVAIMGILLMNTQSMSMPSYAYLNPTYYGDLTGINWYTWLVIHLVADMKFITTFSILFGAGILLQGQRVASRGGSPAKIHYKRMAVLLAFGLIHAYALWYGDILTEYALCGMLLFPIRRLPPGLLALIGILLIAVASFNRIAQEDKLWQPINTVSQWQQSILEPAIRQDADDEVRIYKSGWWGQMQNRFWLSLDNQTTSNLLWTFWRCGGAMLIGMALLGVQFFHGAWPRGAYAVLAAVFIPMGWAVTGLGVYLIDWNGWDQYYLRPVGSQFNYWGSLMSSIGYISLGVLVAVWAADPGKWLLHKLLAPVRAIGRTALSNYIMQTLIGTTIFYGHGLGYFGEFTRVQLALTALAVWAVQLTLSPIWLCFFRQGPLEWLWHVIVYGPRRAA